MITRAGEYKYLESWINEKGTLKGQTQEIMKKA